LEVEVEGERFNAVIELRCHNTAREKRKNMYSLKKNSGDSGEQ